MTGSKIDNSSLRAHPKTDELPHRPAGEAGASSRAAHTPGPWLIDPAAAWDIQTRARVIADQHRYPVAWCPSWDGDEPTAPEEARANARLIAAAPDLLEALKKALPALEYCRQFLAGDIFEKKLLATAESVSAAILKSEGR